MELEKSPLEPRWLDQVVCGDAGELAPQLPPQTIDTIVTSPPYFQQRDYAVSGQLGGEPTVAAYLERLVKIFEAVRPALKPTASAWIVMGDKYLNHRLLGTPWQLALALQAAGWYLRSDCIWHKPNAMPSSVKNRPTIDHEYIFFLTLNPDYYFNADAIREPHVTFSSQSRMRGGRNHFGKRGSTPEQGKNGGNCNLHDARWDQAFHPQGRNKRTVWSIPLSKNRDAHFAVFPEALVDICLRASCPPGGVVLDPFAGTGTTAKVAARLGRHSVNFELNSEYCKLAHRRLASGTRAGSPPAKHNLMQAKLPEFER